MQFTPQQLAGAQRYGSKTRIGNWLEDVCIEDVKRHDETLSNKAFHTLRKKRQLCHQPVRTYMLFLFMYIFLNYFSK